MLLFIAQKLHQMIIVSGIGRFAASSLPENKLIVVFLAGRCKALRVQVNPVRPLFGSAQNHPVALPEIPVFHDIEPSVRTKHNARVHPALFG